MDQKLISVRPTVCVTCRGVISRRAPRYSAGIDNAVVCQFCFEGGDRDRR